MTTAEPDRESQPAQARNAAKSPLKHRSTKLGQTAVKGVFWSGINVLVPTVVSTLVFVVSSRYLGPHEFGIVALAMSIVAFALAFAPGAFGEALVQRADLAERHLDSVFWACMTAALVLYAILTAAAYRIASAMGEPLLATLLPVIGTRVIFDLAATVPNALITRSMAFHNMALRTIIASLVSSAICISLLWAGYGIWALAISQLSVSVVSCVAAFLACGWVPGRKVSLEAVKEVGQYGLYASGNRFLQLMSLDQMLIGFLAGPAALGIFNFARRMFALVNDLIGASLANVSHALLSSLQSNKEKVREAFLMATFVAAAASFGAFAGLAAIAGDLVPAAFGDHWQGAVPSVQAFCVIGLLSSIGLVQWALITSQGKSAWWFYYQAGTQALTLALILAVQHLGVFAIVCAIAVKTFLVWPVVVSMSLRILDLRASNYLRQFAAPTAATIAMLIALYFVGRQFADAPPIAKIATEVSLGALVYCSVLVASSMDRVRTLWVMISARRKTASL